MTAGRAHARDDTADDADDHGGPSHDKPMTLFDHLEELRKRVLRMVLYLIAAFALAWHFKHTIWYVVIGPIHDHLQNVHGHLQSTELSGTFFPTFKLCAILAIAFASPGILWEIWGFVSRGLYEKEKGSVRIFVPVALFLFFEGTVFYYFFIQPATLEFLVNFLPEIPLIGGGIIEIEQAITLTDAVSFFLGMSLVMGLVFELPLVMVFLQKLGIASWRTFARYRRHFLMGSLVVMALLTPSQDMFTLGLSMLPVVVLYEGGILVCRLMRSKEDDAADAADEAADKAADEAAERAAESSANSSGESSS